MKNQIYLLCIIFLIPTYLSAKSIDIDYISITTTVGGISAVGGGAPLYTTPNMWVNLEFKIPIRHNKIYLYSQFRTSFFIGQSYFPYSYLLPIVNMENLTLGGLFGFGALIKDHRNDNHRGWYITLNFGILLEGAVYNFNPTINFNFLQMNSIADRFLNVGFEINTRAIYKIAEYQQFSIGMQVGYLYSPYSGDPFYIGLNKKIVHFHMLTYGLTIGMHF